MVFKMGYCVSVYLEDVVVSAENVLKLRKDLKQPLEDELNDWGYDASFGDDGSMAVDEFLGEKWHDDDEFYAILAPYLDSEATIYVTGEDAVKWKYTFENGKVVEWSEDSKWVRTKVE
jgi:hypothetical protein